jgi:hypothetical protein
MSQTETLIIEGKAQPDQTKKYLMVPFEMPSGVTRVDVAYEYSAAIGSDPHLTGGNTVDIGIFDPRGYLFLSNGFRGWSGSARNEFYLSTAEATPGYMPGPLQQGTWYVCLGAYKIADAGCDYRVTVQFTYGAADETAFFPVRLPLDDKPRKKNESGWYKGELHCHTYHSDGDSDPLAVVRRAESLGLDFLAITDHNVQSQQVRLNEIDTALMLIPGMEVTTYHGHWNIWGAGDWIDFRVLSESDMQQAVNAALEQGYLISCNHPRPYGPEWEYPNISGFHCIEVWNGPWAAFNDVALAYWEAKLQAGERYVAVGGSDSHFLKREHLAKLSNPTLYIYCPDDPSPAALLTALRAGHAFISEAPQGTELYLHTDSAMMGDTITRPADNTLSLHIRVVNAAATQLEICGANGVLQQHTIIGDDWQAVIAVDVEHIGYVRAQVVSTKDDTRQIHALTNPIYLTPTFNIK